MPVTLWGSLTCSRARPAILGWHSYSVSVFVGHGCCSGVGVSSRCIIFFSLSRELMGMFACASHWLGLGEPSMSLV